MIKVLLTKDAQEDLDTFIVDVLERVYTALDRLVQNPQLGKQLQANLKPARSYRFGTPQGEFRICYLIHDGQIVVLAIGPRKEIYQSLAKRL